MESSFKKEAIPGSDTLPAIVEPNEPKAVAQLTSITKAADTTPQSKTGRPASGVEYVIDLDKSGGERLGIDVDNLDGVTLLIESVNEGLVKNWNQKNADKEVRPGDRLVEVNGIRDDLVKLVDECKKDQMLTIKFVVGKE